MSSRAPSVLPPSLVAKLAVLRTRRPTDAELDDILAELAALPAHVVVRASREIATSVGFHWSQTGGWAHQTPTQQPSSLQLLKSLLWLAPSSGVLLGADPKLAWLFLFHLSGYRREDALRRIVTPPDSPFLLAALAWRLNDWVPEVRRAARRCAARVFPLVDAPIAARAAVYLLGRRTAWGRWAQERDALDQLFAREDVLAALAAQLREATTGPLAICLRHALRYPGIDRHLAELARHAQQPPVRALAYRCLISGEADWIVGFEWIWIDKVYFRRQRIPKLETRPIARMEPAANLVREAARDKSAAVRKIAADALIAEQCRLPDREKLVAQLAKDRSAAVRSRADFLLRHPPAADALASKS